MKTVLIILYALIELSAISEAYITKYEQMLQLFPKPQYAETKTRRNSSNKNPNDHPCNRACRTNEAMTCYYYFVAHYDETFSPSCERYLEKRYLFKAGGRQYIDTLAVRNYQGFDDCKYADGVKMDVMVINGKLPGQPIEVCKGDSIVVDVINSLHDITTIHWHGIHQRQTPHMDGVPYITQYPIEPGQAFRYRFEADNRGTHWWHSHVGHQRGFGLAGAMVVRDQPRADDAHSALYDFDYSEHTIFIQDWMYDMNGSLPQNILIDGAGRRVVAADGTSKLENDTPILYSSYTVIRGGRYRFRVIFNGIGNCPISLSIDNHELVVIASDGNDIQPVKVRKITVHGGERFDFILHANQEVENYWLRVKGYNFCATNKVHQEAILHYKGANRRAIPKASIFYEYEPSGKELNAVDKPPTEDDHIITIADLRSVEKRAARASIPYHTYYTSMNVRTNNEFLFQMDYITFSMPPHISLLQTRNLGISQFLCNKTHQMGMGLECRGGNCECANVIEVPAFKEVEFVISSTSQTAHPIHLHGYTFRVVGSGVLGEDRIEDIEEIDRRTPLPRRIRAAPLKDTVQVPAFGYTILRFYTDSPGYWILHCHISTHSEIGMAAVLRVGAHMQMKTCPVSSSLPAPLNKPLLAQQQQQQHHQQQQQQQHHQRQQQQYDQETRQPLPMKKRVKLSSKFKVQPAQSFEFIEIEPSSSTTIQQQQQQHHQTQQQQYDQETHRPLPMKKRVKLSSKFNIQPAQSFESVVIEDSSSTTIQQQQQQQNHHHHQNQQPQQQSSLVEERSINVNNPNKAYITKYEQMLQIFPKPQYAETKTRRNSSNKNPNDHPCNRACRANEAMTCYYYFVAHYDETFSPSCERYLEKRYLFKAGGRQYIDTLAVRNYQGFDDCKYADGVKMDVMVINGKLPGQPIEVCKGDSIVVDVINSLHDITTIHWHGIHQQQTPPMDGVPYITQYPIEPGQAFRYRFEVDNRGTHWWHSHVGHQRGFGLAGAMVVRDQPRADDAHSDLYDFDYSEHTIFIQDWMYDMNGSLPQNILIDGAGRRVVAADGTSKLENDTPILYSSYKVIRGGRYRFRVIFNGIGHCPISLSIDNHELVVIASDGNDIEPVKVGKITVHGGERFDFILHANQEVENYWLRVKGYNFCATNKVHQEAILHYKGANRRAIPKASIFYEYEPSGKELNSVDNPPTEDDNIITIADLRSVEKHAARASIPYHTYYTSMNVRTNKEILFQMDYITFSMPPHISLLQTRNLGITKFLCNKTQQLGMGLKCRGGNCECANVIEVPAFKEVEFVISSTSQTAHPIHLHGYTFRVVGSGVLGEDRIEDIEEIDRRTPLPRRISAAPLKDTVQVPSFGYTILRFYTDNPGYWMLHCHISTHSELGMAAVLRVGAHMEMKTCPEGNCGLCNSVF